MPSLLETFYIMFESNAKKVKEGSDDARKSTDDLENSLNRSDRAAKQLGDHFMSSLKGIAAGLAATFAVSRLVEGINAQEEYNAKLGITAKLLGVNISDLDAYQRTAERSGGTTDGFTQSITFLNKNMAAMAEGGQSRLKPFFEHLKIQALDSHHHLRPLFDILGDLSDRFQHLSSQEAAGIGEKMGLDEGTILMLQQGRRAIDEMVAKQKELGVANQEDAERAHQFHQVMLDLDTVMAHIYTTIGTAVVPAFTWLAQKTEQVIVFMRDHKTVVEGFFIGLALVIGTVYLPAVIEAAAATLAWLAPFILIGLAIAAVAAAFALAYDDVTNFLEGNQSVIGELSKRWPWIGELIKEVVRDVAAVFQWGVEYISAYLELLWNVGKFVVTAFATGFRLVHDHFGELGPAFQVVGTIFISVAKAIVAAWQWIIDKISKVTSIIKGISGFIARATVAVAAVGTSPVGAHVAAGQAAIAGAHLPIAAAGSVHRNYTVNTGPVTVQTQATDSEGIGRGIGDALQTHLRHAVNQFDDGVAG